jgi:hypothetical protein
MGSRGNFKLGFLPEAMRAVHARSFTIEVVQDDAGKRGLFRELPKK